MAIVFVSPTVGRGSSFGGGRLSVAMLDALREVEPRGFWSIAIGGAKGPARQIVAGTRSRLQTACQNLLGFSGTLTRAAVAEILTVIAEKRPNAVWLDSSLLGRLAKAIKRHFPDVHVVAFFHNIEFDMQRMRVRDENVFYAVACASDWLNERLTLRYADTCLMLTRADSARALELYRRQADFIFPVTLPDSAHFAAGLGTSAPAALEGPYVLFVGALFGPNLEAARFIVKELAPVLPDRLRAVIVGRGFDAHSAELTRSNVAIVGAVDDLAPWYAGASLVLAPVFSGGGMKVKIAEALMHGKRVLASRSAAIGYEESVRTGSTVICDEARDYLPFLAGLPESARSSARQDYETYYSAEAGRKLIRTVLRDRAARRDGA